MELTQTGLLFKSYLNAKQTSLKQALMYNVLNMSNMRVFKLDI